MIVNQKAGQDREFAIFLGPDDLDCGTVSHNGNGRVFACALFSYRFNRGSAGNAALV